LSLTNGRQYFIILPTISEAISGYNGGNRRVSYRHSRRMYANSSSNKSWETAPLRAQSVLSAPFAPSAVSPYLGLFHARSISPHPPLSHSLTPDFLHQKRPTKAQIFAPSAFLLCPAALCRTQTLLDSPSIHVTMGKRTAPELRHRLGPRPSTTGRESWLSSGIHKYGDEPSQSVADESGRLPCASVPGFSRHIFFSHLLQRVVAPLRVMVSQPASAGLLDQWIHP